MNKKAYSENYLKGRGAQINPANQFHDTVPDFKLRLWDEDVVDALKRTEYIPVQAKSIVNKVESPDVPMGFSINPYQGCEHGCVYCYARNTHNYWGYSSGLDFERKILIKKDAPKLLEQCLKNPKWQASPIILSGNTDCYQQAEQKYELTRKMLELFWKYRHPVGIITKSALIARDLDILEKLASKQLLKVHISITSLDDDLQRKLEPRAASVVRRLNTVQLLSENGIPVTVLMAPIIPGLTQHEILPLAKKVAAAGARGIYGQVVRLNGDIGAIFEDWLRKNFPDRAEKVLNQIKSCHGGNLSDSRFGTRMKGEGEIAAIIQAQLKLANKQFFAKAAKIPYNLSLHKSFKSDQLSLF